MDGKLDVGTACFHTDLSDNVDGPIPHGLILPVGEGLSRGHSDAIPRVNTHGIKVFYGTNDDHIIFEIPHDFQLVLLPADEGLFHDDLGNHAGIEAGRGKNFHLFPIIGHTSTYSAQGKTGPDNEGITDPFCHFLGLCQIPGYATFRHT